MLLAIVIRPLTTQPFRDGAAPFLLIIETPPTFGPSFYPFPYTRVSHKNCLLVLSREGGGVPSLCMAVVV